MKYTSIFGTTEISDDTPQWTITASPCSRCAVLEAEVERLRLLCWENSLCPNCGCKADPFGGGMCCTDCDAVLPDFKSDAVRTTERGEG